MTLKSCGGFFFQKKINKTLARLRKKGEDSNKIRNARRETPQKLSELISKFKK